jgi:hypothetical protein
MEYKVRNWDQFQHYRDRNPPWIKLHFSLLSSRDWVMLDDASRVLAIACMLVASRNDGLVDADPDYMRRVAYLNKPPNFKPLIACGFLESASATLADASTLQADARPEERQRRVETETEERQRARKRASRTCPPDFELDGDLWEWAVKNCPGVDVARETEAFKDYTFASAKTDWVATWRNWMRKAKPTGRRLTKYEESMNELARRSANGHPPTESPVGALGPILRPQIPGPVRPVPQRGVVGGDGIDVTGTGQARISKTG